MSANAKVTPYYHEYVPMEPPSPTTTDHAQAAPKPRIRACHAKYAT